jgi:cis-3-alkyl-4-acyloxetan-2-one decarboxylase
MANWRDLYPFPSKFVELPKQGGANVRMHYVESGDGNRPTILCVHGNPTWSFTYRSVVSALGSEARVVAVDHVGCGLSDKPQDYPYSLAQHIDNLVELIEQLDLRNIHLLVHDWGGAIGLGAGLRVLDRIDGAVILNTAAFPPPYVPWRIAACRIPVVGNWAMRQMNLFARAALHMTLNRLPRLEPAVAEGLIAPYSSWHNRVAIARFVQDIPRRESEPTWKLLAEIEQQLPRYHGRPIHLLWGMRDWCFRPECLRRFQSLLPDAKCTELSDVGHYVMEEAAAEVQAELRELLAQTRSSKD